MSNPYNAPTAEMADMEDQGTYDPKMFAVSGRIGRLRYLAYTWCAFILLYFVLGILAAIMIPMLMRGGGQPSPAIFAFFALIYIPIFAIGFIYAKRRLNDLDQSGWLSLLILVPFINALFGLYLLFAPGTEGPNRFGPAPSKNSNAVIWLIVIVFVGFFGIGILAAISIPAYQNYVKKAHAQQLEQQQQQPQQPQQEQQ